MKRITLPLLVYGILLASCGVPQADYDKLKAENEQLKLQIEECQFNASELLTEAKEEYERLEYRKSKRLLESLIDKYPKSKEARKGKKLLKKVNENIATTEKALQKDKLIEDSNTVLGKMRKRIDNSSGAAFYTDKSSKLNNTRNAIHIYAGSKEKSKPWLGVAVNYFSKKEWLHIQKIMINADGKIFNIEEEKQNEFKSKKESGGNREWIDQIIKREDIEMFRKIANSEKVVLTLIGKEISEKRIITPAEKKAMQNVLEVYKILGG